MSNDLEDKIFKIYQDAKLPFVLPVIMTYFTELPKNKFNETAALKATEDKYRVIKYDQQTSS